MKMQLKTVMKSLALGLLIGIASPGLTSAQEAPEQAPLVEGLKDLKKLNRQLVAMAAPAGEATVSLVSRNSGGTGSGVIVSEDGLILTAAHVVAALSEEIIVIFPDGSRKEAKKLGADFDRDAAMVQITEEGSYPHAALGTSEGLLRNEWCVALGHPGGFDPTRTPPVRLGRVLRQDDFVVTDCAVVGGDSGGPLFDIEGKVIGIHSNIGATLSENRHVPVSVYQDQWEDLKEGKKSGKRFAKNQAQGPQREINPEQAVMGVRLGQEAEDGKIVVMSVMDGSPAAKAGIKAGDTVVAVNGKRSKSAEQLSSFLGKLTPGKRVKVALRRDGKMKKVRVKLARLGDLMGIPEKEDTPDQAESKPKDKKKGDLPKESKDKKDKDVDEQAADDLLKELLDEAMKNGGQLKMTPERMKQLGGIEEFTKRFKKMAESMEPGMLQKLMQGQRPVESDEFFRSSMKALEPVVAQAAKATVVIFVDGKASALGTVVSEEGWILTKDTETKKGKVSVLVEGEKMPAKLVQRFPKRDLALFQIKSDDLHAVPWAPEKRTLPLGSLLTASSPSEIPLGIGVISVQTRAMAEVGFLGIQTESADGGVRVVLAVPKSPAEKAGLKKGDLILTINGKAAGAAHEFGTEIRQHKAGETVKLTVRNGEKTRKVEVTLASRKNAPNSPRGNRMNQMSGPLSERLAGFPEALQHDIPISPNLCGGPLLDLNGRAVGINVSRAGRVKTLAIPTQDVLELLSSVKKSAEAPSAPKEKPAVSPKERNEIKEVLKDLRESLLKLEKRLDEMEAR